MTFGTSTATLNCDLLVIGSGAGGLSAAVTAAHLGLHVVVAEKEALYGGTSAWSGGWMWVPCNPLAQAAGMHDTLDQALSYLRHELGSQWEEARVRAYLEAAPAMVDFFRQHTALQFIDGNAIPDFHGHSPGAAVGGRSVCAAPFDGRRLGAAIQGLKSPIAETTLWGMGIASGAELRHFLNALRSPTCFAYVARRVCGHMWDVLRHGRGMRLVNGQALVAALVCSALERGVDIRPQHPAQRLLQDPSGRVTGAVLGVPEGHTVTVSARCGVVLACGGFPHDEARKRALLPHAPTGREHWSAAARGNTGDGLRLGESVGGVVTTDLAQAAALAPVSLVPRVPQHLPHIDTHTHFPHLIERGKPGLIAVTAQGQRFTNEANSYHDFMQALLQVTPAGQPVQAWLVCDHRFIRRYGLGAAKPAPMPLGHWLRSGYVQRGHSLRELAETCGITAGALAETVAHYNAMAHTGTDDDFAKGQTAYNRIQGDADGGMAGNPCMAPLRTAPFYAVRIVPGSLGTFAGLRANTHAQVLRHDGVPIAGLYVSGNDMSSVMGGHYPSGGITLGPAMTWGYLAAHHAVKAN